MSGPAPTEDRRLRNPQRALRNPHEPYSQRASRFRLKPVQPPVTLRQIEPAPRVPLWCRRPTPLAHSLLSPYGDAGNHSDGWEFNTKPLGARRET